MHGTVTVWVSALDRVVAFVEAGPTAERPFRVPDIVVIPGMGVLFGEGTDQVVDRAHQTHSRMIHPRVTFRVFAENVDGSACTEMRTDFDEIAFVEFARVEGCYESVRCDGFTDADGPQVGVGFALPVDP